MYTESVPHYGYGARGTQTDLPPYENAKKPMKRSEGAEPDNVVT
jgi:hypothetical protein